MVKTGSLYQRLLCLCTHRYLTRSWQLLLVFTIALLSSCTLPERSYHHQTSLPSSFSQSGSKPLPRKWWHSFEDEQLNILIEEALSGNFHLLAAYDRLDQAMALSQQSRAELWPHLTTSMEGEHSQEYGSDTATNSTDFYLDFAATYEVDLWGKLHATSKATALDLEASRANLQTAAISLSAEVAELWYTLVEIQCQLHLIEKQIAITSKGLQLIRTQFRAGLVPMADILQQRQLLEANVAKEIQLLMDKMQTKNQLDILLGLPPGRREFSLPSALITLPPLPDTGIPANRLLNRPDVKSCLFEVQAADARVATAMADRFPTLDISFSLESSASHISDLFTPFFLSIITDIVAPLFDAGTKKTEIARTKAVTEEKLHILEHTLISAAGEVENTLIAEQQQLHYMTSLTTQLDLARQTTEQVKLRYIKGTERYERVLSALISQQDLEQSLLSAQKILILNRIQLCRALAGGWQLPAHPAGSGGHP